jgi:hypothetical protein
VAIQRVWQGQDVEDSARASAWLNELEATVYSAPKASDQVLLDAEGIIAETFPNALAGFQTGGGVGIAYWTALGLRAGDIVSGLVVNASAVNGVTLAKVALYDTSGNLLASSANQSALFATTGWKQVPFSTAYPVTTTGACYAGFASTGTTINLAGWSDPPTTALVSGGLVPAKTQTSVSDIPGSMASATATGARRLYFGAY